MQYAFVQWLLFFFLYCFLGWVWECLYVSAHERKWVNRGFLCGLLIPMHGFGAIINLLLTSSVKDNILFVFLLGMLGITVLEYVTGVMLQSLFHARYWDYSGNRFNLNGYICPFCSFGWGLFTVMQIKLLHPFIENAVLEIPAAASGLTSTMLVVAYAVDTELSIQSAIVCRKYIDKRKPLRG